ncbi:MAG: hydrogenase 2 accessory protein HypG [Methanomassiliicoccales archaeon PtaU1.Bin124]|nr:MAG: hydrogenase 2 accessory protein HypG [Methanomassiliicoccales archaeon PtaU1.Bin124]
MCLAVPGRIVSVDGKIAQVDFGGVTREANVSMVDADVGSYVIIHAGFAIQVVDELEAKETIKLWEELLQQSAQESG